MPAPKTKVRKFWLVMLFLAPCLFVAAWFHYGYRPEHRLEGPRLVYWVSEGPEDLRFLEPKTEAVALLAISVDLLQDSVRVQPDMQPPSLPSGIQMVAVVRIVSHADKPPALNAEQRSETLQALLAATHEPGASVLQIDFDARLRERAFYSQLLRELRQRLGPAYPISITAPASWCIGDRWIRDLPVNEVVPLLFSMGSEEALLRSYFSSTGTFPEPLCRGSLGISTSDWWPNPVRSRTRVYVFDQAPWTRQAVEDVRSRIRRGV